jgi:flagella basal body P-ring formation protein FlgA
MVKFWRLLFFLSCVLICSLSLPSAANAETVFTLKKYAAVHGERVRFDEIVFATRGAWEKYPELRNIELWPIIKGQTRVLPVSRLLNDLKMYLGEKSNLCYVKNPLVIKQADRVISEEDLQREVVKYLTMRDNFDAEEVNYRDFHLPEAIFLDFKEDINIKIVSSLLPGRNRIRLDVVDDEGKLQRSYSGSVFIDVWKTVPCAARVLNRKEIVLPEYVRFEKKNLAYIKGEVWDGQGGPWRVKRPVGVGQVLLRSNLEKAPLVERGSIVTLKFEGRFVSLSVLAVTMEEGDPGDIILVRNLQSQKVIKARIIDANTVVVP